ncbi:MAG: hypothetical protein ABWX61_06615 [Paenisporosarcina sp.]
MKNTMPVVVIVGCLVVTFFLYNKQMGAIPLLLLSFYLFFYGWQKLYHAKNKK